MSIIATSVLCVINIWLSVRVWYISSAHLPYVSPLSLDGINTGLLRVALRFLFLPHHTHHTLVSSSNHSTYCT